MLIHKNDANPITNTNPLPVHLSYDSDDGFGVSVTSPDAQSAQVLQAATTGQSIYITDVVISSATPMNVQLEDTSATVVMYPVYLTAQNPTFEHSFSSPLPVTSGRGLNYQSSAGGTVTVTVSGFVA